MLLANSEEYNDPILYDKENEAFQSDISFLLEMAKKQGGVIIDVACGTGRATIPLAKEGFQLIGVDIHSEMINEAKRKAAKLDLQIEWLKQDCTILNLPCKSNFIYTVGNSFQHFLTNEAQDRLLTSVNKHLEIDGVFVFNIRFPSPEELLQPSTEEYWKTYVDPETHNTVVVSTISSYDSLRQIQHYTTIRKYKNNQGVLVDEKITNISLRYVFPQEMERMLFSNGFEIEHIYKDWAGNPITNDSYEMIYVCKKKK
ncbi:class I SAM-dependent methyltransferase [Evansella sp. AB-rgal1]|uniref:class I SAM-dependent methyltransferase n=1 Tax=Evansella sp. AB-rgal1 TaxID=3242696 RepID=UPI00359CBE28